MASNQAQPPDLQQLLADPIIIRCNLWFEVGLELGLESYQLEIIKIDHRNDTVACKMQMWNLWLRDGKLLHLKKLHEIIRKVERRARAQRRENINSEDRRAVIAIGDLQTSVQEFEQRNKTIAEDYTQFVDELFREKTWVSIASKWAQEYEEWEKGETATKRENLVHAIREKNFSSVFVKEFLQQKLIPCDDTSDTEIEHYLRQELLEIEIERSRQARGHYEESKEHNEHLQDLLDEIKQSEDVIRSHLDTYKEIWEGLKKLGVGETRLQELNKQLEDVKKTLEECTNAREECAKVHKAGEINLMESIRQVKVSHTSLDKYISQLKCTIRDLQSEVATKTSLLESILKGFIVGAVAGHEIIPILGAIPGAFIGGIGGLLHGIVKDDERQQKIRELEDDLDDKRRVLRMSEITLESANAEWDKLQQIRDNTMPFQ